MPIERSICIQNVSKEVFDVRDKIVMRCAYDAQNALGRLCDEKVYETDLTRRLRAVGFREVHTQVPVRVVHGDFQKEYRFACQSFVCQKSETNPGLHDQGKQARAGTGGHGHGDKTGTGTGHA